MPNHVLNTLYFPYSSVDNSRVKIGTVIAEIPFWTKEHSINQIAALPGIGICSYFFLIFFNITTSSQNSSYDTSIILSLHKVTYLKILQFSHNLIHPDIRAANCKVVVFLPCIHPVLPLHPE